MNSKLRNVPVAMAIFLAFAGLAGCDQQGSESVAQVRTVTASVISVEKSEIPLLTTSPGSIVAEQQAQIASRLMGFIREFNVKEGQSVVAGERLFTVDPTDIQGQMNMARAGLAQAEAARVDSETDYERFGKLYKEEAIPKMQWDKIRLQHQVAQQQTAAARAAFDTASAQMKYATVQAPFAGVITQKMANAGDLATPGRPLLVMENPAKLQVQTSVTDEVFHLLKLGSEVAIQIDGISAEILGKVSRLVPAADPITHSYLVKIDLPPGQGLKSGTFVRASFALGKRAGIRLPVAAVQDRAGITGVFVVDAQGIAHYRMVRTGAITGDKVEIQAGLNPGERVVSTASSTLQSGDRVTDQGNGNG